MTELIVRQLGLQPYEPVFDAMKALTEQRSERSPDEFWLLQHEPVYTQGQAGKQEYIRQAGDIPVVQIDRGGQVTYHGPGQLTLYLLIDLKRLGMGVRGFVTCLEQAIIATLALWGVEAIARRDAPGVYVDGAKIAALGLRVRKGRCYHGLNFNISMDMRPWAGINPCGLGVPVTQLADLLDQSAMPGYEQVSDQLLEQLSKGLGYNRYKLSYDMPVFPSSS